MDRRQILLQILGKFERMSQLIFPLKSPENL